MSAVPSKVVESLSPQELSEFARLEKQIQRDIDAATPLFVRIAKALEQIRDTRLYRADYDDFRSYCRERWGKDHGYVYRLINAATVTDNLAALPIGSANTPAILPMNESQARPLVGLEPDQQREAWSGAVESAGGKQPTAKQVQASAEKVAPKAPAEPKDVTAARKAGIIPEGATVTIDEPEDDEPASALDDPTGEHVGTAIPHRNPNWTPETSQQADAASALAWLETLPIRAQLADMPRERFDREALLFREISPQRLAYRNATRPMVNAAKTAGRNHIGPYMTRHNRYLAMRDPSEWVACNECKDDSGRSTGQIPLIGPCPKCNGEGYHL